MPIYDYKCPKCDKIDMHFSEVVGFKDADVVICECGVKMERQFSIPSINMSGLKGIGQRTDVELSSSTMEDSMDSFKDGSEI